MKSGGCKSVLADAARRRFYHKTPQGDTGPISENMESHSKHLDTIIRGAMLKPPIW